MNPLEFTPVSILALILALVCTIYRFDHEDELSPRAFKVAGGLINILIAAAAFASLVLPWIRL